MRWRREKLIKAKDLAPLDENDRNILSDKLWQEQIADEREAIITDKK